MLMNQITSKTQKSTLENNDTKYIFESIVGHKRTKKYIFEVMWQNYIETS